MLKGDTWHIDEEEVQYKFKNPESILYCLNMGARKESRGKVVEGWLATGKLGRTMMAEDRQFGCTVVLSISTGIIASGSR